MPSLSAIEAFVHTADRKSFRQAAADLAISPAAVSKAVARLEQDLGGPLLNRTTRHVSLTPEGALYLEHCRRALAQLRAGHDLVSESLNLAEGTCRVSASLVVGRTLTANLRRLSERHPRLLLELNLSDDIVNLAAEKVDVVVRVGERVDSSLIARPLRTPVWTTLASPAYLARHGAPADPSELLEEHACLRFKRPQGSLAPWRFLGPRGFARRYSVSSSMVLNQGDLLVEAAAQGLGVCQVFDFMVVEHVQRGLLVALLEDRAAPGPPLTALCLPGRQRHPRTRAFLDFVSDVLGAR